jgi:hypothetical protein
MCERTSRNVETATHGRLALALELTWPIGTGVGVADVAVRWYVGFAISVGADVAVWYVVNVVVCGGAVWRCWFGLVPYVCWCARVQPVKLLVD